MDIATLIGLVGGIVLVVISMIIAGGVTVIPRYIDPASMMITFGGALMAMIASTSIKNFVGGLKSFTLALKQPEMDMAQMIQKIIELSNVARKEGLLSLEEAAGSIEDDFLKKGILLVVDGTDPELVRAIMETELSCIQAKVPCTFQVQKIHHLLFLKSMLQNYFFHCPSLLFLFILN